MPLVVGFDLDMTLVDSRPGIAAALRALSAETGVFVDPEVVLARIGPKLETELANWFPADDVTAAAAAYRRHYWDTCVAGGTIALPGASASIEAVRERGGTVIAITAKMELPSRRCLDNVGLAVDIIVGHVHGDEKRDALKSHDANIYVGDTTADVEAAVGAGAIAVGVTTGMHNAEELTAAGADVVFASLESFPEWLASVT